MHKTGANSQVPNILKLNLSKLSLSFVFAAFVAVPFHSPGAVNTLPILYKSLNATTNGNLGVAASKIQEVLSYSRGDNMVEQKTFMKMLRKSKQAINRGKFGPKEAKLVVVDNVTTAIEILIRDKFKPGIVKNELLTGIRHLHLGQLNGKAGFIGTMAAQLSKGKFFLKKHKYAPRIKKAIQLVNQAKKALNRYSVTGNQQALNKAKQLTAQAKQVVKNSQIYKNGGGGSVWGGFF